MKRIMRAVTAALLLLAMMTGVPEYTAGIRMPWTATAQAAGQKAARTSAYLVTWDQRTIRSGKSFAQSDNGTQYTAPLDIHYTSADKVRVFLKDPKGRIMNGQDKTWTGIAANGTVSFSATIPKGSAAGTYRVVVELTRGKKKTTFQFLWKVVQYVHTALPSAAMQRQFDYLRSMLPQGKYWNHGVKNVQTVRLNNGAVTTISSSRCSAWSHRGDHFYDPAATCNYANHGYQCHGFAMMLATYVWGAEPTSKSRVSDRSAADTLEPGDVVRYLNDKHTIFVLRVEKGTVYFADCNWGHTCRIRWNGKISAASLKKSFSYVYKYSMR